MMLVSPPNFLEHYFIILNTLEIKILQFQKIDFMEKNDTFVRYCPSMVSFSWLDWGIDISDFEKIDFLAHEPYLETRQSKELSFGVFSPMKNRSFGPTSRI